MLERIRAEVIVCTGSPPARQALERLAARLGLTVEPSDAREGGPSATAVLFHLAGRSDRELDGLRAVVRDAFPSPVIVLTTGLLREWAHRVRAAGAADIVPLGPDERQTEAALAGVLARLRGPDGGRCPRCPGDGDERASTCLMRGSAPWQATGAEDAGNHWRCFPFLAASPAMLELEQKARKAAGADATVLITGESGSGKEVLARYIHWNGPRRHGPFVKVNCAALPENLLESELFGYEKGAFTGAEARKPGRFEQAKGGVILLDEIGEMSVALQSKLLQVLQEQRFTPLGGVGELAVDVQILATTNRSLDRALEAGRFRSDLFFRLSVIELRVPPLRERLEDIGELARYFLGRFSAQYGHCAPDLDAMALERLSRWFWPGNVRELENLARRAVILGEKFLAPAEPSAKAASPGADNGGGNGRSSAGVAEDAGRASSPVTEPLTLREVVEQATRAAEHKAILAALERTRWNRTRAARELGVSYKTLLAKMKQL